MAHSVKLLKGTSIKVACVIGFHEGTQALESKIEEAKQALVAGATELDVVLNRDDLSAGSYVEIHKELAALRALNQPDGEKPVLKLILETSQLIATQVIAASVLAGCAGFDFIKTSTGFCGRGASVEDVKLMISVAHYLGKKLGKENMKVKASGGVRTLEDAKVMLSAGAERIGASAGVAIMKEFLGEGASTGGGSGY